MTEADLECLVFWDEAAVLTNLTPGYGRAPRGERVVDYVPHGAWERLTMAAGIRLGGVCAALAYEAGRRWTPGRRWRPRAWGRG